MTGATIQSLTLYEWLLQSHAGRFNDPASGPSRRRSGTDINTDPGVFKRARSANFFGS